MSVQINPQAVVDPKAELADGVVIGPFAIVEGDVKIGPNTQIDAHSHIKSGVTIGTDCHIYPYASVGNDPQDISYKGEWTELIMGDRNIIREFVTINRGTPRGRGKTVIGSDCMIMAYCHVAHDCQLGNHVIMANSTSFAGHVEVEDWVTMSGYVVIHQFCRVGTQAFLGAWSALNQDVPPYCLVASGYQAKITGLNRVGLKRRGFSPETIDSLKEAYRTLFRTNEEVMSSRLDQVQELLGHVPEVQHLVDFVRSSARGICYQPVQSKRSA